MREADADSSHPLAYATSATLTRACRHAVSRWLPRAYPFSGIRDHRPLALLVASASVVVHVIAQVRLAALAWRGDRPCRLGRGVHPCMPRRNERTVAGCDPTPLALHVIA